jgi:hypothetical protein
MHKAILTAAALALTAPLAPALPHDDDDYNRYSGYSAHSRFHDELEPTSARMRRGLKLERTLHVSSCIEISAPGVP